MTLLENRQLLAFTTLHSFTGADGSSPTSLVQDGQGNLYGTTYSGGASFPGNYIYGYGTVFEIAQGSNTITTLASFNGTNGSYPTSLVQDGQGNLYGTTYSGGADGDGTVFEIAQGSNTITTLASFNGNGTNTSYPNSLVRDGQGNLYGTTYYGGAANYGTVFEIAQGSNTITTLASFNGNGTNASYPNSLVLDGQGNLYGATVVVDGPFHSGTVSEIAQGSNTITTLASFNDRNGDPRNLVLDGQGNLYGTTGSVYGGTVFEIAQGSNTITTLASNGAN